MIFHRVPSLRARLLLGLILGIVVLQIAASIVVYVLQQHALYARFDQALISNARALMPSIKYDQKKGVHFDFGKLAVPEYQHAKGPDYFQVWRGDGVVVARSQTLGEADLPLASPSTKPMKFDCVLPRNEAGRAVLVSYSLPQGGPPEQRQAPQTITLVVAKETKPIHNDLWTLGWIMAGTAGAVAVVAAALAWVVVSHALVPVNRLAKQIETVKPTELDVRVEVPAIPSEIAPVVQRLNEMLARLQSAFERERAFTADAAHELRTPLAGIRSIAEVAISSPQSDEESARDFGEILQVATGMQAMIEKLLMLARLDAGQVHLSPKPVNLRDTLEPLLMENAGPLGARNVTLRDEVPAEASVQADRNLLRMVLGNVLGNAVEYVNDGGEIALAATTSQAQTCLSIANTGCTMEATAAENVFERFWRADPSRTGSSGHWGLGLSLVLRATSAMGGTATAQVVEGGVFRLSLCLPSGEMSPKEIIASMGNAVHGG